MKIKLDNNHYLHTDPWCYYITAMIEGKGGKPYERRVSGYAPTFNEAVVSYIEKSIISSQATEISHLRDKILDLERIVMKWGNEIEKNMQASC